MTMGALEVEPEGNDAGAAPSGDDAWAWAKTPAAAAKSDDAWAWIATEAGAASAATVKKPAPAAQKKACCGCSKK